MSTQQRLEFYPVRTTQRSILTLLPLADAKAHLKVEHDDEDDLIEALIGASIEAIENMTGQLFASSVFYLYADAWHSQAFTFGPVKTITAVEYYNEANELTTLSTSSWWADLQSTPQRITFSAPPSIYSDRHQGVRITATCGHTTLPHPLKQAALMLVGHYYENRQQVVTGATPSEVPLAVHYLTNPFRLFP